MISVRLRRASPLENVRVAAWAADESPSFMIRDKGPPKADLSRRGWPYSAASVADGGKPTKGVQFAEAGSMSLKYINLPAEKSASEMSLRGQVSLTPAAVVSSSSESLSSTCAALTRRP